MVVLLMCASIKDDYMPRLLLIVVNTSYFMTIIHVAEKQIHHPISHA